MTRILEFARAARHAVAAMAALTLVSCASTGRDPSDPASYDPLEGANRYVFELNRFGDEFLLKPVAVIYRGLVPDVARDSVANALANLRLPWTAVNDVLQGEWGRAGTAVARFALNSTFGFLGLFDMAKDLGLNHHDEDFGQTLGVAGVTGDPYLVLPIFGPSSPRDTVGLVADSVLDPVSIVARGGVNFRSNAFTIGRSVASAISGRERTLEALAELERGSDYYAAVRSAWRQKRAAEINNATSTGTSPAPRFGTD